MIPRRAAAVTAVLLVGAALAGCAPAVPEPAPAEPVAAAELGGALAGLLLPGVDEPAPPLAACLGEAALATGLGAASSYLSPEAFQVGVRPSPLEDLTVLFGGGIGD